MDYLSYTILSDPGGHNADVANSIMWQKIV